MIALTIWSVLSIMVNTVFALVPATITRAVGISALQTGNCAGYGAGSTCESDPEYPSSWCSYPMYGGSRSGNHHPRAGEKTEM